MNDVETKRNKAGEKISNSSYRKKDRSTNFERQAMTKVKDEPHASVEGGYGGAAEIGGSGTAQDVVSGSVVGGVEKSIQEVRYELCLIYMISSVFSL